LSKENANEISNINKEYTYLKTMKQNSIVPVKKIVSKVTIKGNKSHYNEARLVQLLEERGIGRPSTFSSLVDKIQERNYVKKEDVKGLQVLCKDFELSDGEIYEIENTREFGNEKNKLVIQPLGILVVEFLIKHFSQLFDYDYTRKMEDDLDKISKSEKVWNDVCRECNDHLDTIIENIKKEHLNKMEIKIDEEHVYTIGKYGPVIKKTSTVDETVTFKKVKKYIELKKLQDGLYTLEDIIDEETDDKKPKKITEIKLGEYNNSPVFLKKGKFGLYISWDKTKTRNLNELGNRPIESITFEEIEKYLSEDTGIIRTVSNNIIIRKGVKGDYIFFKTPRSKKASFFSLNNFKEGDYKICDIDILKSWIKETHNIS
jgi:DNA topoisomerase-1